MKNKSSMPITNSPSAKNCLSFFNTLIHTTHSKHFFIRKMRKKRLQKICVRTDIIIE